VSDLLAFLGGIQDGGGLLAGLVILILEIRQVRRDFNRHRHDEEGKPFLVVESD
jgi:hypothetical protein